MFYELSEEFLLVLRKLFAHDVGLDERVLFLVFFNDKRDLLFERRDFFFLD